MLGIPAYWWLDHSDPGVDRDSLTIGWWRLTETRWVTTGERGASSFFPTDGDPIKAAKIIVDLASYDEPPERIQLGANAVNDVAAKLQRTPATRSSGGRSACRPTTSRTSCRHLTGRSDSPWLTLRQTTRRSIRPGW